MNKSRILPGILILVLLLCVFWPYLTGLVPFPANFLAAFFNPWAIDGFPGWQQGIPYKHVGMDDLRLYFPWRSFSNFAIRELGELPFWNPYNFSGNFHLGLAETGIFYPVSILFFFLPVIDAWSVLIMVQPVIAALGMYLYIKALTGSKPAAIFAGTSFGLSGIVITRMVDGIAVGHTLIWMPYVFYGLHAFYQKRRLRYLGLCLAACVLSFLAGWFQFTFYILAAAGIYILGLIYGAKNKRHLYLLPAVFILIPLLVSFQLVPSLQALSESPRFLQNALADRQAHLMPFVHLWTLLTPDFFGNPAVGNFFGKSVYKEAILYIGVVPLVFAFFTALFFNRRRVVRYHLALIVLSLATGFDWMVSREILKLPIPIMDSFLPNRIFLIFTFSAISLSGIGLAAIMGSKPKSGYLIKLSSITGLLFLLCGAAVAVLYSGVKGADFGFINIFFGLHNQQEITTALRNMVLPASAVAVMLVSIAVSFITKKTSVIFYAAMVLVLVAGVYQSRKYISFSRRGFVYPYHKTISYLQDHTGLERFISTGNGYIWTNIPLYFRLPSPEGIAAMYPKRYGELVKYALGDGTDFRTVERVDVTIAPQPMELLSGKYTRLQRLLQLLSVRKILVAKKDLTDPKPDIKKVFIPEYEDKNWMIWNYTGALPRFYLTNNYIVRNSDQKILDTLFSQKLPYDTLILENIPNVKSNTEPADTKHVKLENYSPNSVRFRTSKPESAVLFMNDTFTGAFKAKIDGKPVKILRANYAFRALEVPGGFHRVEFYYDTAPFTAALFISMATLVSVFIISILVLKKGMIKW